MSAPVSRHAPRAAALALLLGISGGACAADGAPAVDEELRDLRQQAQQILRRIDELEQRQRSGAAPEPAVATQTPPPVIATQPPPPAVAAAVPAKATAPMETSRVLAAGAGKGFLELQSGNTTLTVGGHARFEAFFNNPSVPGDAGVRDDIGYAIADIPISAPGGPRQLSLSARNSRFWFKTRTATEMGPVNTLMELDFFGADGNERTVNGNGPRMRHAYAEFGGFTFGQTYTTFMDVFTWPTAYNDPAGVVIVRQPLVRWTRPFSGGEFLLGAEQPETTLTKTDGTRLTPSDDRWPDLAGRATWFRDWGQLSLSGLLRQIRQDGAVAGVSDAKVGGAIHLAGRIKTLGQDNLRFGLAGGNALGRYTAYNTFNDGSVDAQGRITLNRVYSGYLSYEHWWNREWRSSAVYSLAGAHNDLSVVPATVTRRGESYHLNLSWSPVENALFGVEYMYARREQEDSQAGQLNRLYFNAQFMF